MKIMLTLRPTSSLPSTSQPLLKAIGQLRLCLQNTSDSLLHSGSKSLSSISSKNNFQDDEIKSQWAPFGKEMFTTERKLLHLNEHGRKLRSTVLQGCRVPDNNIKDDGEKKSCDVQNKDFHTFNKIQKRFIMNRTQGADRNNSLNNDSEMESIFKTTQTSCNSMQMKQSLENVSGYCQNCKEAKTYISLHFGKNPKTNMKRVFLYGQNIHNSVCMSRWRNNQNCKGSKNLSTLFIRKYGWYGVTAHARSYSTETDFRQSKPWRILFFGTDNFAVKILRTLNENKLRSTGCVVESLDVVSNPGKTAVREYANCCDLPVLTWPVRSLTKPYDVGVLASFGHLIPGRLINSFPHGILNVHPSLLPQWRGSAPIIHSVLNGDTVTGISIMKLRPKRFDVGSLLLQKEVLVPSRITSCQLSDLLAKNGAQVLIDCLSNLSAYENMEIEQSTDGVTLAHKLKPSMANINWHQQTCVEIDRLYRAVSEMMPLRSHWKYLPVKLLDMVDPAVVQDITIRLSENVTPGTPIFSKERHLLLIKCKDGFVGFQTVIIKKKMSAQAFFNGYLSKPQNKDVIFT